MEKIKLYNESQIRESLNDNFNFGDRAIDFALSKLTPIELPSDKKIKTTVSNYSHSLIDRLNYKEGIIWVIERIKEQVDGK